MPRPADWLRSTPDGYGSWFGENAPTCCAATTVDHMSIPDSLRYTSDHEWVDMCGSVARVGITDYAQNALGDVVFVQLPTVGSTAVAGDALGEIESTKSVSDVFAPVTGTVVSVNQQLGEQPQLLNTDPYGEGWLCEIDITTSDTAFDLVDAATYRALVGG